MKDLFQKFKVPIIILAILLVLFIAYNTLFKKKGDDSVAIVKTSVDDSSKDIIPLLLSIKDIDFNLEFFKSDAYKSLRDYTQTIVPEKEGKTNPFAPIAGITSSSTVEGLGFAEIRGTNTNRATTTTTGNR